MIRDYAEHQTSSLPNHSDSKVRHFLNRDFVTHMKRHWINHYNGLDWSLLVIVIVIGDCNWRYTLLLVILFHQSSWTLDTCFAFASSHHWTHTADDAKAKHVFQVGRDFRNYITKSCVYHQLDKSAYTASTWSCSQKIWFVNKGEFDLHPRQQSQVATRYGRVFGKNFLKNIVTLRIEYYLNLLV